MANGDQLAPLRKRGTVATTNATTTTCISLAIPVATEGQWFARAWVSAKRHDSSGGGGGSTFAQGMHICGHMKDGSTASAPGASTPFGVHNPDSNSWTAVLDVDSNNLRLRVTGEASAGVRWDGEIELYMREQAQSWGG